jgi:polyhydroxyalkanoate synthesis regulator phasin
MEETASAQGDFGRTSDQLANKQRQLDAKLADLSATVGTKLIPVATKLATVMVDDVIPALEDMAPALDTVGKAVGGALEVLGPFVDLLGAMGENDIPKASDAVQDLGRAFADFLNPGIPAIAREFADAEAQIAENAAEAEKAVGGLAGRGFAGMAGAQARARDLADSVKGISTQSRKTARNVGDDLRAIVGAFQTAKDELTTLGQDTADAIYDPVIARGKLAIVEAELVKESKIANSQEAADAEIDDLERTGKMTKRQARAARRELREQVREAQVKVAELQKERIGLIAELQAFGKLSAKEQGKFLKDLNRDYRTATGAARAQIALLIQSFAKLQAAQEAARLGMGSSVLIGGNWGGHAAGGPAEAGVPTWVGEQGKELIIPGTDSFVVPHAQSMAIERGGGGSPMAMSGGMTLNITVNASPGMTPGAARQFGEALGPAIYEWGKHRQVWA